MSARDAESGSSTYKGGSGRAGGLGNGGLGGGMGAGMGGGGAARNGGYGNRTGLTTGNTMFGGMAFGRPGGFALNSSAFGVRPQAGVTRGPLNRPANPGLLGNPAPASVPGVNPAVDQEMALPTNPPSFVNNPFVDKPATLADYVRSVVKSYQDLNAPPAAAPAAAWTPASSTNPAIQSVPGYANVHRGFSGSNWQNNRANWPRGGVPGTRSLGTTEGGYPSLGSQDTRPAGVY